MVLHFDTFGHKLSSPPLSFVQTLEQNFNNVKLQQMIKYCVSDILEILENYKP